VKWKKQHGNRSKMPLPIFWEITRQKTIVICWLVLYNPTKLWGIICLYWRIFEALTVFFPENLRAVSTEHGEQFYQDIFTKEKQY
jgi:hypothetical protein